MTSNSLLTHQLLENLTTAVLVLDKELRVTYLNPAAESLLETSGVRAQGTMFGSLFVADSVQQEDLAQAVRADMPYTRRSLKLVLAGGREITVDLAVTPFEAKNSSSVLVEIQALDRFLRISREETMASSHSTSRSLVRGLAHEIKNPLGGLRGAAQLLEKELPDEKLKDYTSIIIEEADRLRNLVDRMLGPNKLSEKREINIHEVLERVCSLIDVESERPLQITRDYDPSIPNLIADSEQLIQAVLNVMRNSLQALATMSKDHEDEINVRTRIARQFTAGKVRHKLAARIDIRDNGPGIANDILDAVFYPMVSGRAEGTGLGLSISQSIIHQHQGIIECHSNKDFTEFSLILPLEPVDDHHK